MPLNRLLLAALFCLPPLLLAGCATPKTGDDSTPGARDAQKGEVVAVPTPAAVGAGAQARAAADAPDARIYRGTGIVVKGQLPGGDLPPGQVTAVTGGGVVLNFEGADLREVIRNILGDILGESYTIDPAVGGQVTIRTTTGIPREALPSTLEMLLRMNGASMVKEGSLYKIVPQAAAVRGNVTPQLGTSNRALPAGFSVQIVPLHFVGAKEMLRLLEPFARDAQAVRIDELRNLVILSGTERELRYLLDAIAMFDIDWMTGMSAGVFVLQNTDVKTVVTELDKVLGDRNTSPLAGIVRIIPIERMNALLVITPQPAYLEEAKKWIARLDSGAGGDGPRFYVYQLQNQRAEKLAPLLQQAFTGRAAPAAAPSAPTLAPGTPAGTIVSPPAFQAQTSTTPTPPAAAATPPAGPAAATTGRPGEGLGIVRNLQVVADKDNNTLLVVATPIEYTVIEAALKKLDVPARQVLMDVTIAEVTLKDEIDFGIDWLFKGGAPSGRGSGGLLVRKGSVPGNPNVPAVPGGTANNPVLALAQGFTYIINNANFPGGVQAVLRLMDTYGNTKVIANPRLAAMDNQKATIKSGDRIPINQNTYIGSGTGAVVNNAVTTTSQYIDTGVLLQVTPHINAGGLVTLDVQAEVSNPGNFIVGEAPPINTRSVQTIVSVQSGQTMVMGGLIGETKQNQSSGLPLLARIPYLGGLFGEQTITTNRTELVMFITPQVLETELDVKGAIDDLRKKMVWMDELFPAKPSAPFAQPATTPEPATVPPSTSGPQPMVAPQSIVVPAAPAPVVAPPPAARPQPPVAPGPPPAADPGARVPPTTGVQPPVPLPVPR
jgi:general secretion pathway protein D